MKQDSAGKTSQLKGETAALNKEIADLRRTLDIQQRVAFAAGLFLGDVTIRTLLESLAEGVVIIDSAATIVLVNNQVERLFGYPKDEIVGQPLSLLLPEKFRAAHEKHVDAYFEQPRVRAMGQGRELSARHKDGHEFPVEISLSNLDTTSGCLAMAFITDITLREQAITDLEARNDELDAFAHTVAHDLKGSLLILIGFSELLTDDEVKLDEDQVRVSLDMICRVGEKMAGVIDELLLLSSVRKEDVEIAPLDMLSIISEASFWLSRKLDKSGAETVLAEDFPSALGYAPWVEEVWYNYLSNAVKYGGKQPRIELGGGVDG